jgi:hypothetical protein
MIEGVVSTFRMWTSVTVMWVEAVINVAVKVARTMKPGAGSDEHSAAEPLRPIVAVRGAIVRREVVVAIRADRTGSDIYGDLGGRRARDAQQSNGECEENKKFLMAHECLLTLEKGNPDAKVIMSRRD